MTADIFTYRNDHRDSAVIFLHGFTGDIQKTWKEFPDLLMKDGELDGWDVFSVGYPSSLVIPDVPGLRKASPGLQALADTLTTHVRYSFDRYEHLAFVAHSMGGLIIQRAVLDCEQYWPETLQRLSHIFLFGTPSNGLLKAVIAKHFTNNNQVRDMAEGEPFITRLRRDWEGAFGYDAFPFHFRTVAGNKDDFVPSTSAHACFPRKHCETIPGGHLEIVKPASPTHLAVRIVVKGLRERRSRPGGGSTPSPEDIDPHELLSRDSLNRLLSRLASRPPIQEAVAAAYRSAVSPGERWEYRFPDPDVAAWSEVLRNLLDLSPEGRDWLTRFLRPLGAAVKDEKERGHFTEDLDAIVAQFGHEKPPLPECPVVEGNSRRLFIDLNIRSHQSAPRIFDVRIHECRGDRQLHCSDDFQGTRELVGERLDEFLADRSKEEQPSCVEVFVEPEYVTDVFPEGWMLAQKRKFPISLGREYPVVLRLKRPDCDTHPRNKGLWERKWSAFMEKAGNPGALISDVHIHPLSPGELEDSEALWETLLDDKKLAIIAPFIPSPASAFGDVMQEAGIPVAVWGKACQSELDALFSGKALEEFAPSPDELMVTALPETLRAMRRADRQSFANRITLMWDDAARPWDENAPDAPWTGKNAPFIDQPL